jgi:predicted DCC family thiol-disulfide oxidoreductase YuxK
MKQILACIAALDTQSPAEGLAVRDETGPLTVYFDGSCPLCTIEISHYAAQSGADGLVFVDVATPNANTGMDLSPAAAMSRFHVRFADGRLVSGAAAFIEIWRRLPRWHVAARLASLPGMATVLEVSYRLFLPVRPLLSRFVGWLARRP